MNLLGGVIGAVIGGLIGAAVWAGVAYGLNFESGWIAWGIGLLAGLGMKLGSGPEGGAAAGGIAVVIAILSILLGKWAAIHFVVSNVFDPDQFAIAGFADVIISEREEAGVQVIMPFKEPESVSDAYPKDVWREAESRWNGYNAAEQEWFRQMPERANPDYVLSYIADDIVLEAEDEGVEYEWPEGKDFETAWRAADYPAEVWVAAEAYFADMDSADREAEIDAIDQEMYEFYQADMAAFQESIVGEGFVGSFSPFDFIFFGLAVLTAFKVGAGEETSAA